MDVAGQVQSSDQTCDRQIMQLLLDITQTRDGRYEGSLTEAGTSSRHDFAGILELLAILEERLGPAGTKTPLAHCETGRRPRMDNP